MDIDSYIEAMNTWGKMKRLHNKNLILLYKTYQNQHQYTPQEYEIRLRRYGALCKKYARQCDLYKTMNYNNPLALLYRQYAS